MSVKNIVIVNDFAYINGGAGKVALMSAKALARRNYHVVVFSAVKPVDTSLKEIGVEVICTEQNDILHEKKRLKAAVQGIWNVKAYKEFKSLLATLTSHETIIHFHGWSKALSASVLFAASRYEIPIAVTIHDYFLFCPNGGLYNYKTCMICTKQPCSCTCYLTNCDSRNYFQKIWRSIRSIVQESILNKLHNRVSFISIGKTNLRLSYDSLAIYAKKWYQVQNPIELNDNKLVDICSNDKYLFVGRLSPEKGTNFFCQALTDLGLSGIVLGDGDGTIKDDLQKRYPNIEFAGWCTGSDKDKKIRACKALLFPSLWYEGSPLTIPEMLSYGIPCIVPDKCAASEMIVDGRTGYVFKIGDIESIKEAILKYEKTDRIQMQQNIQKTFHPEDFSLNHHVNELESVYEDIMQSF